MIKTKKQMYIVVSAFAIILMLFTTTYAFFNYTRTGTANVIRTGRISFNSNQTDTINLTNVFPIDRSTIGTDTTNTDEVVISITGDTTYTDGLEYLVTAVDVNNTIGSGNNQKNVPISISVTASNLGTSDDSYFTNRGGNSSIYKVLANETVSNNEELLVGYIAPDNNQTSVNGSITIKAYLDSDLVAISDTYNGTETATDNMGTTPNWVEDRTVLTTTEWNGLQTNGVSFKVKVESNEGTWVEENSLVNGMNMIPDTIPKSTITKVSFIKDTATHINQKYNSASVKADLTYNNEGMVKAWVENDTELIVASPGKTYLNTAGGLFYGFSNVTEFDFQNMSMERLTVLGGMFAGCYSLQHIDLSHLGGSNISSPAGFLSGADNLAEINMSYFNFGNTTDLSGFFQNFSPNAEYINLSHANMSNVTDMTSMFGMLSHLEEVDLSNVSINNVSKMVTLFKNCGNLERIYVSPSWNIENITLSNDMFTGCTSLVGQAPNTTYAFDTNDVTDKTYAKIATDNEKGYLTDISLKP